MLPLNLGLSLSALDLRSLWIYCHCLDKLGVFQLFNGLPLTSWDLLLL
jgi:hypothetical protein